MKPVWTAFGAGGLFGAGLVVSGMVKPAKVIGFLDVRHWDPSLAFVMMGAIAVHMTLFKVILKRGSPFYDFRFHIPTRKDIDLRLVAGAAVFGVGWGLGGFCPGPGLVSLGAGVLPALVFVIAMTAGMWLESVTSKLLAGLGTKPGTKPSTKRGIARAGELR
jgi:uncharacterized membrane protein YedE/YeeE